MICWLCLAVRRCKHFHLFFNFFQAASLHFPFSISILSQIKFSKTWYWSFFLLWYLYSLLNPPRARYQQIVPPQICAEKGGLIINENFTLLLKQTHVLNTCRCRIHNFQVRYIHSHFSILLWWIIYKSDYNQAKWFAKWCSPIVHGNRLVEVIAFSRH